MNDVKKPVRKFKEGGISIAEWDNPKGPSFTLQKSYKPQNSEDWVNTSMTLFPKDIDNLITVLKQLKGVE